MESSNFESDERTYEGGCDCGTLRYQALGAPMIVHCCHCRWCQRETGAAFAMNAFYESDRVVETEGEPLMVKTPSPSGFGQVFARCPKCYIAIWSHYSGSGPNTKVVRVGTFNNPDQFPPDVHIFTSTKQPWVQIPEGVPMFEEFYRRSEVWSQESLRRWEAIREKVEAYRKRRGS